MSPSRSFAPCSVPALVVAALIFATTASAQTSINPGFNLFSAAQDAEIGAASAAEVASYVEGIGQRLAAWAGGPEFSYRFRVVDASDLNAFALPGGFVYLNRGILREARTRPPRPLGREPVSESSRDGSAVASASRSRTRRTT